MDVAQRLFAAVRRTHGDGIEAFVAVARVFGAAIIDFDRALLEPRGGAGRRKVARKHRRRPVVKHAAAPIATPAEKKVSRPTAALSMPAGAPAPAPVAPAAIKVTRDAGAEAIEFAGKHTEVTARQAQFLDILAKGSPNPIGRQFIADKLWPGRESNIQDVYLGGLVSETRPAVESIGLVLKTVRGVGIALQPAEAETA